MKYSVTVEVTVEADCSRAAVAHVLGCMSNELGEADVQVDPFDESIPVGDEVIFASRTRGGS